MAAGGGSNSSGSRAPLLLDWTFLNARTRNAQEVQALKALEAEAAQLAAFHSQAVRIQQVILDYQAVWQQLLCCQRAELMCLIPLAGQRMQDLASASAEVQRSRHRAQTALRSAAATVQTYVSVNRSTADELGLEQSGAQLAASKRELASYEENVLAMLAAGLLGSMACASAPYRTHQPASVAWAVSPSPKAAAGNSSWLHHTVEEATPGAGVDGSWQRQAAAGLLDSHAPPQLASGTGVGQGGPVAGYKRPLPCSCETLSQDAASSGEPQRKRIAHGLAQEAAQDAADAATCKSEAHQGRSGNIVPSQPSQPSQQQQQQQQQQQRAGSSGAAGTAAASGSQQHLGMSRGQEEPLSSAQHAAGTTMVPVTPLACLFQGHILVEQQPMHFVEQQQHYQSHLQQQQQQLPSEVQRQQQAQEQQQQQQQAPPFQQQSNQNWSSKFYSQT